MRAHIAAGADPNARDANGRTPLHWAAGAEGGRDIARALIEAGTDVNARADNGDTPLHWEAWYDPYPKVAEVLIEAGADPDARNGRGETPQDQTARRERRMRRFHICAVLGVCAGLSIGLAVNGSVGAVLGGAVAYAGLRGVGSLVRPSLDGEAGSRGLGILLLWGIFTLCAGIISAGSGDWLVFQFVFCTLPFLAFAAEIPANSR